MNHRIRASLLAGLSISLIASCAYLPQGYPSRTVHAPVDSDKDESDTSALFVDTGVTSPVDNPSLESLNDAPIRGLRIRKSKRGNMDSYVVRGQRYFTLDSSEGYSARGLASWYGPNFHGRVASNGEIYDMYRLTAAHKTLPLPTYARVTHLDNGKSIVVKINDRGPFSGDRLIDLSFAAALELGMVNDGTAMVEIKALTPEELLVMSGTDNKMGIDFYYDYSEPGRSKQKVAADSLFVDDRTYKNMKQDTLPLAQAASQSIEPAQVPESEVSVADQSTGLPETDVVADTSAATMKEALVEGTVVDLASIDAEFIEVVVPGRRPPAEAQTVDISGEGIFTGVDIPLTELVDGQSVVAEIKAKQAAVPLLETAALPVSAAGTIPALATASQSQSDAEQLTSSIGATPVIDNAALNLRYYLQAGVFANVSDAERVATDIVLEIPREEVHVKPLKDSTMYRVTVGPIVNKDHADEVSLKLETAGIENYTVKVNES